MQQKNMEIQVFVIPGGEEVSLAVYEQLADLLEMHEDLFLTVYRGMNTYDGTWSLVLIGDKPSFARYREQIRSLLSEGQAQRISVPPESLVPLIKRFLARQAEMQRTKKTLVKKHHPLSKKHYAKKQAARRLKREKKRHR